MELMEGLTLLNTETQGAYNWIGYILAAVCLIPLSFVIWCIISAAQLQDIGVVFLCSIVALATICLFGVCINVAQEKPTTVYKVTIDDTVSMVEFYERYEILDQEGLIFTITEKEK